MERDTGVLTDTGGTSRFPQTPSPGPLRGQAPSAPERDTGVLNLRNFALAFWVACVLVIAVPALVGSSSRNAPSAPLRQPVEPPGPHRGTPLKQ